MVLRRWVKQAGMRASRRQASPEHRATFNEWPDRMAYGVSGSAGEQKSRNERERLQRQLGRQRAAVVGLPGNGTEEMDRKVETETRGRLLKVVQAAAANRNVCR